MPDINPFIFDQKRRQIAVGRCFVCGDSFSTIRRTGGTNDVNGRFNNLSGYNYIDRFIASYLHPLTMDTNTNFAREGAYASRNWSPAPAWSAINPIPSLSSQIDQLIAANPANTITMWDIVIVAMGTNDGINPDGGTKPTDATVRLAIMTGLGRLRDHGFKNIFYIYPESKHQPTLATTLIPDILAFQIANRDIKVSVAFWDLATLKQLDPYLDGTHPNEQAGVDMARVMSDAWEIRDTTNRLVQKADPKLRVIGNFWEHSPAVMTIENVPNSPAAALMVRLGGVDKFKVGAEGDVTCDSGALIVGKFVGRNNTAFGTFGAASLAIEHVSNVAANSNAQLSLSNQGTQSWALASYRPSGTTGYSFGFYNNQITWDSTGNNNNGLFITSNNRVGFCMTNPEAKVHINSSFAADNLVPGLRIDLLGTNTKDHITMYKAGNLVAQIWQDGTFNSVVGLNVGGTQVVRGRITGWGAATGTRGTIGNIAGTNTGNIGGGYNQTLIINEFNRVINQVNELNLRFLQLVADLRTHGLIGE